MWSRNFWRNEYWVEIEKLLGTRIHPNTNKTITYYLCKYKSGSINIKFPNEIEDISFKTPDEVFNSITTDLYPPVIEYLESIKN